MFSGERGETAAAEAAAYPGCVGIEADLSSVDGARKLYDAAVTEVGQIDILVLNGPGPRPGTASKVDAEDLTTGA
ncbi:hypothetical protein CLV47_10359 [Antricoccus suffuscus]|uniref:Short subunit dehydrogenase n=1 Tax=Antricoccus suffuscus TaxID=1629062 RepID=A0A2T1A326_9ACTN|nr:hypothetical protein [Antricoccus suffuscus]PRZ43003.1 hypothetical protein CLV47_10359 [Antricoccus suffuscus]